MERTIEQVRVKRDHPLHDIHAGDVVEAVVTRSAMIPANMGHAEALAPSRRVAGVGVSLGTIGSDWEIVR